MKMNRLLKSTVITITALCLLAGAISYFKPFKIEGQWSNSGNEYEASDVNNFQSRELIIFFNGSNCNFSSPFETYRFKKIKGEYFLTVSSLASEKVTFAVNVIDNDHIEISGRGNVVNLERID